MSLENLLEQAKSKHSAEIEKRRIQQIIRQKENNLVRLINKWYAGVEDEIQRFSVAFPNMSQSLSACGLDCGVKIDIKQKNSNLPLRVARFKVQVSESEISFVFNMNILKENYRSLWSHEDKYIRQENTLSTIPFNATDEEIKIEFDKALEHVIKQCFELE